MNDTGWISTCSPEIARAALELLEEVIDKLDLLRDPITIAPYPYGLGIGQEPAAFIFRKDLAEMLVKRGV